MGLLFLILYPPFFRNFAVTAEKGDEARRFYLDPGPTDDFFYGVHTNSLELIEQAIEDGANISTLSPSQQSTILQIGIVNPAITIETLKYLIVLGVNVNHQNKMGFSALHDLVTLNEIDKVALVERSELLLNAGIDPNLKDNESGRTALILASGINLTSWVENLLAHEAKVNERNFRNWTALQFAAHLGNNDVVKLLLLHDADPEIKNSENYDALFIAAKFQNWHTVRLLVEFGANVNVMDKHGRSLLDYSIDQRNHAMTAYLTRAGAKSSKELSPDLLTSLANFYNDNLMGIWSMLVSTSLFGLANYHFQKQQRLQQRIAAEETAKRNALSVRNQKLLHDLNGITQPFYPRTYWKMGTEPGIFTYILPQISVPIRYFASMEHEKQYSCVITQEDVFSIIAAQLTESIPHEIHPNSLQYTLTLKLTHRDNPDLIVLEKEWISSKIKANLYKTCKLSPAFQENQFAYTQSLLASKLVRINGQLAELQEQYKIANTIVSDVTMNLHSHLRETCSEEELLTIKRTAPLLKALKNTLQKSVDLSQLHQCAQELQQCSSLLQSSDFSVEKLDVVQSMQATLAERVSQLFFTPSVLRNNLSQMFSDLQQAIALHEKDKVKSVKSISEAQKVLEEKRQQREQKELEAKAQAQRALAEAEEKKRQHRIQVAEERRKAQEEQRLEVERLDRIRQAELKRQAELREERLRSSSSSTSSTFFNPHLVREKVIAIGDILQRYDDNKKTEALRVQTKYALLALCLRLFELTNQFVKSRIANDIRNALMHQHRYLTIEFIYELADLIAHKPNALATNKVEKLENVIHLLEAEITATLKNQLNLALVSLALSDFFLTFVKTEREKPCLRIYIETMLHLTRDLASFPPMTETDLLYNPDAVLAMNGLLMSFGECYQQTIHLKCINLLSNTFLHPLIFDEFAKFSLQVRNTMGHSTQDIQGNLVRYAKYLKNSALLVEHLESVMNNSAIADLFSHIESRARHF